MDLQLASPLSHLVSRPYVKHARKNFPLGSFFGTPQAPKTVSTFNYHVDQFTMVSHISVICDPREGTLNIALEERCLSKQLCSLTLSQLSKICRGHSSEWENVPKRGTSIMISQQRTTMSKRLGELWIFLMHRPNHHMEATRKFFCVLASCCSYVEISLNIIQIMFHTRALYRNL